MLTRSVVLQPAVNKVKSFRPTAFGPRTFGPTPTSGQAPPVMQLMRAASQGHRFESISVANAPIQLQDSEDEEEESTKSAKKGKAEEKLSGLLGPYGAKQQGLISTVHGKEYLGPRSNIGKRAHQVTRHFTGMVLNRLTQEQTEKAGVTVKSGQGDGDKAEEESEDKAPKKGKKKSAGAKRRRNSDEKPEHSEKKRKHAVKKPVEVQMSSVGGRLLISTNNLDASKALYANMLASGGPFAYVQSDPRVLEPAMDKDRDRPERHRAKLQRAIQNKRRWQDGTKADKAETEGDRKKATAILTALQNSKVGFLDPEDEKDLQKKIDEWRKGVGPSTYVVYHDAAAAKSNEHAERVQTRLRDKYLKEFENELSTPPSGPKTQCLGCHSYHQANHPSLATPSEPTGSYFAKSSPVVTPKEVTIAQERLKTHPATGSISQSGYQRNSDYPDSDSDEKGNVIPNLPSTRIVPYSAKPESKPGKKHAADEPKDSPQHKHKKSSRKTTRKRTRKKKEEED